MSNVVQFLETLARNSKRLSHEDFVDAVMRASLDPAIQEALIGRDIQALIRAMDTRGPMCCIIFPADNEPKENEEQPQEDGSETPEQEPSSKAA